MTERIDQLIQSTTISIHYTNYTNYAQYKLYNMQLYNMYDNSDLMIENDFELTI